MTTHVERRQFVTRTGAAEILGCSAQTVDRLRHSGRLRAVQIVPRGRVRFARDEVEALLEPELRGPLPARKDELQWS
jgi:excisionase family DNA binding protein